MKASVWTFIIAAMIGGVLGYAWPVAAQPETNNCRLPSGPCNFSTGTVNPGPLTVTGDAGINGSLTVNGQITLNGDAGAACYQTTNSGGKVDITIPAGDMLSIGGNACGTAAASSVGFYYNNSTSTITAPNGNFLVQVGGIVDGVSAGNPAFNVQNSGAKICLANGSDCLSDSSGTASISAGLQPATDVALNLGGPSNRWNNTFSNVFTSGAPGLNCTADNACGISGTSGGRNFGTAKFTSVDTGTDATTLTIGGTNATTVVIGTSTTTHPVQVAGASGGAFKGNTNLSTGSATFTVPSGATCVCSVTNAFLACQVSVSGTTATITVTGGGSDNVSIVCL